MTRDGSIPTQLIYEQQQPLLVTRTVVLRVAAGPDAGASCALTLKPVRVGASPDNDLVLTDPSVSRCHAEFVVQDRGYLVRDLDSTNGTYYRGARVREVLLGGAAEVRLGNSVLRLELGEERSEAVASCRSFGGLIGSAPAMQEVYGLLAAVAPTDLTVLVQGETGTGKELVAEALHRQSERRSRTFSVLDCGALPPSLIESELFGHVRGAFTGAVSERVGVFERSKGGTVFLDEIGELPIALQTRLLRVLDRRTIRRVGSDTPRKVDVRLIAATNRDLRREVEAGRFRSDLFYRLSVVRIELPPLRERKADIRALARHFLLQAGAGDPDSVLTPHLLEVLTNRRWPGNVRELRNVLERVVVMADGARAEAALVSDDDDDVVRVSLPGPAVQREPQDADTADDGWLARAIPPRYLDQPLKEAREEIGGLLEAFYLGNLLERHGNNISAIARDARVDRRVVRRLLRKHGLR